MFYRKQESSEDESESSEEVFVTPSKNTRSKPLFGNLLTANDLKVGGSHLLMNIGIACIFPNQEG
jgi:hypothetical protein